MKGLKITKGLAPYYFTASIAGIFTLMIFISLFLPPRESSLIIFKSMSFVVMLFLSARYVIFVIKKRSSRITAFRDGLFFNGTIHSVRRVFVPWKSARDFKFEVDTSVCGNRGGKAWFQTSDCMVASEYRPGSPVEFYYDTKSDSFFFPAEAGLRIKTPGERQE